jgi:hypothetical protein
VPAGVVAAGEAAPPVEVDVVAVAAPPTVVAVPLSLEPPQAASISGKAATAIHLALRSQLFIEFKFVS